MGVQAFLISDGVTAADGEWYAKTGDASDYVCDSRPKFTKKEGIAFSEKFADTYGYEVSASAGGQVYDYARFFFKIVEECEKAEGKVDAETLLKYGTEVVMKGGLEYTDSILQDKIVYQEGELDPVVGMGYYVFPILQLVGGEQIAVWPDSMKEADPVIPDYAK